MSAPVQGGGGGQVWGSTAATTSHGRQRRPLLYFGPANFSKVIVKLISQLMVTTKDAQIPRLQ